MAWFSKIIFLQDQPFHLALKTPLENKLIPFYLLCFLLKQLLLILHVLIILLIYIEFKRYLKLCAGSIF